MPELVASRIQEVREHLTERRGEIRKLHSEGTPGTQVAGALTVLVDGIAARLALAAFNEMGGGAELDSGIALVALGGYGRAELAPFSDVDLMFLYRPAARRAAEPLCDRLVRDFWDVGLALGSSIRTLAECATLARRDISVHTALLEARHVAGDSWLTGDLRKQIGRLTRGRRLQPFINSALAARAAEQEKFGSTVYLLEPDLKKSKGGLRELHLLRWIAYASHGIVGIDRLERETQISPEDAEALSDAREFLLRARNDLHFQAGRAQDRLTRDEQVRVALAFGFRDRPGMLAVEQFMQTYYRHCAAIDGITERFIQRCRTQPTQLRLLRSFADRKIEGRYRVSGGEISPLPSFRQALLESLEQIVHLFALAKQRRLNVAAETREQIRTAAGKIVNPDTTAARSAFLAMLREPGHLAHTLRHLSALGILEKLIPEFAHARGLIQFNQYHKYTVDEHSILCVSHAEDFQDDSGPLGQVYREIRHKEILHLALLLHDLGKGFEEDHSELGREIALRTAEKFSLEPHLREMLVFLVHQHLMMAHLAFRRDTSDDHLLVRFARDVGTPEVLKMFFVFTASDIASVGPETWTSWKADVLADLYGRTIQKLTGDVPTLDAEQDAAAARSRVAGALAGKVPEDWLQRHLEAMTPRYIRTTPVERIAEHLRTIHTLPAGEVLTTASYNAQTRVTEYTVYTFDWITPGLFSKIAGVLAAKGLDILSAQITTHQDGVVVDLFEVMDYDYNGEPPLSRLTEVGSVIREVLLGRRTIESLFAQAGRIGPRSFPATPEPTQIKIDNDTSDRFTIIEAFASDRQGLLYIIARTMFELGLSVSLAKIATSLDQVLDVFYITDQEGRKITDRVRLDQVRKGLERAIEEFGEQGSGVRDQGSGTRDSP